MPSGRARVNPESVWISVIESKTLVQCRFQAADFAPAWSARFTKFLFPQCAPQFRFCGVHVTQGSLAK